MNKCTIVLLTCISIVVTANSQISKGNWMMGGNIKSSQTAQDHGLLYCNTDGSGHPHIDALEFFDPNLATDPLRWIPRGLYQDLRDANNETRPPQVVNDAVSGHTNQQMFNAFNSSITTLQGYRTNFLQTTTNATSAFVAGLFTEYHY